MYCVSNDFGQTRNTKTDSSDVICNDFCGFWNSLFEHLLHWQNYEQWVMECPFTIAENPKLDSIICILGITSVDVPVKDRR